MPEISNILPSDTQSVISVNMDRLRNCTLGTQAFEPPIGFAPNTFKQGIGLGVEEIDRLIHAENFDQHWSFNVMKTHQPVTLAQFQTPLGLKKGPKAIMGRNYFLIAPNPLLDHLTRSCNPNSRPAKPRRGHKKKVSPEPLTLVLLDDTTIVIAQRDVMEEFLQSNAQPPKKAQVIGETGGEQPPTASPPGGRQPRVGRGGSGSGDGAGTQFADRDSYLTIDASLKSMLDRFEQDRDSMVMSARAADSVQPDRLEPGSRPHGIPRNEYDRHWSATAQS